MSVGSNTCLEEPLPVQSYSSSRVAKSCGLVLPTNRSGKLITDKPLPPIPNSPRSFVSKGVDSPYFEYMFASAGVGKDVAHGKYSPDNLSFVVDSGGTASLFFEHIIVITNICEASNDGKSGIYVWDEGKDNVSFGLDSDGKFSFFLTILSWPLTFAQSLMTVCLVATHSTKTSMTTSASRLTIMVSSLPFLCILSWSLIFAKSPTMTCLSTTHSTKTKKKSASMVAIMVCLASF